MITQRILSLSLAGLGGVTAVLLALCIWQNFKVEGLREEAARYKALADSYQQAARENEAAFLHASEINEANAREAERQRQAAEQAEIRANMLAAQVESQISQIKEQAEQFNDEQCRALDEPLPDDFVGWLRGT